MSTKISPLSVVDPKAEIGTDVEIGPFCTVGPDVEIGDRCRLISHVAVCGRTTIGVGNLFYQNTVIGGDPQDTTISKSETSLEIGDRNVFREGVTVNRGADKEDGVTRVGNRNFFMANSHVAHNCHIFDDVILVNGVLLGGHVHVHDKAIVSGNSVVHHFATVGTLAFVGGGCRLPHDLPPYMLLAGSDKPDIKTINLVGMRRAELEEDAIYAVKRAHRLLFRERKSLQDVRELLDREYRGDLPVELTRLFEFISLSQLGKFGRAREAIRATGITRTASGETKLEFAGMKRAA